MTDVNLTMIQKQPTNKDLTMFPQTGDKYKRKEDGMSVEVITVAHNEKREPVVVYRESTGNVRTTRQDNFMDLNDKILEPALYLLQIGSESRYFHPNPPTAEMVWRLLVDIIGNSLNVHSYDTLVKALNPVLSAGHGTVTTAQGRINLRPLTMVDTTE